MKEQRTQQPPRPKRPARPDDTVYCPADENPYRTDEPYGSRQPRPDDTICIDDETFYNERRNSSVRCYKTAPPTAAETRTRVRTVMHVTKHQGPPPPITPRASLKAPQSRQQAKQKPVPQQTQKRKHWLFYAGCGALASLALWTVGSTGFSWLQAEHDYLTYGAPRTYQMDANVGHQGTSHFIVENLRGDIIIMELHPSDLAETKVYQGPTYSGPGTDDFVATVSFEDVNGDGKPDMVIAVNNQRFVLINTGTAFRPTTPADKITDQEVN
jgi:hypothetical protein